MNAIARQRWIRSISLLAGLAFWNGVPATGQEPVPTPDSSLAVVTSEMPLATVEPRSALGVLERPVADPGARFGSAVMPWGQGVPSGPRFTAGTSVMIVVPRFESNLANVRSSYAPGSVVGIPAFSRRYDEFQYNFAATPRVWVAAESTSGLGIRVGWWQYAQSAPMVRATNEPIPLGSPLGARLIQSASPLMAIASTTSLPGVTSARTQGLAMPADQLAFTSGLGLTVWDIEGTISGLRVGRASFIVLGGLRYLKATQDYNAYSMGAVPQSLLSSQEFEGVGPSGGVEIHWPLTNEGISLYGIGRIGFLFGSDRHESRGVALGLIPPYDLTSHDDFSGRQRFLPTFDLEMGLEWARPLGAGRFFVRGGAVAFGFPLGSGSSGNGNIGLFGLVSSVGFDF